VRSVAVQQDGKIVIGGDFANYAGNARPLVARLLPNGASDPEFEGVSDVSGSIRSVLPQPDGRIWIAGSFSSLNGASYSNVARLQSNGHPEMIPELMAGAGDEVFALAYQSADLLLVAGEFMSAFARPHNRITRIELGRSESIIRFKPSGSYYVPEGSERSLIVERLGDLSATATVDFTTIDSTAIAGEDYVAVSGTLVFGPNQAEKTITLSILNDSILEPEEAFIVLLENVQGAVLGTTAAAQIVILENTPSISFVAEAISFSETAGTVNLMLQLRGYTPPEPWSVDYEIIEGTATLGEDFIAPARGTIDLSLENSLRSIPITLVNDGLVEGPETFIVRLFNPVGPVLIPIPEVTVTIRDNDEPVSFGNAVYLGFESRGEALISVWRGDDGTNAITVEYSTGDGTAEAGIDYVASSGTLFFPAGLTTATFTVPIINDCIAESDKTVLLTLDNPSSGASLGTRTAVLRIVDRSRPGTIDPTFAPEILAPYFWMLPPENVQPDGKILVPDGNYSSGLTILRLRDDGAIDPDFQAPDLSEHFTITGIANYSDGRSLVLMTNDALLRLERNGSLDTSFSPPPIFSGSKLFPQPDGKVIIAWYGVSQRLNEDGSNDTSFDLVSPPQSGSYSILRLQPDGKLLGSVRGVGGADDRLMRWNSDGSLDDTFLSLNARFFGRTEVQQDGKILAIVAFQYVNGVPERSIVRLFPTGELDPSFTFPAGLEQPQDFLVQANGKIIVALQPKSGVQNVIRLNPDGSRDTRFQVEGTHWGSLVWQPNDKFIIGRTRFLSESLPRLSAAVIGIDRSVRLTLSTHPGVEYILQTSTNLFDWTPVSTNLASGCTLQWTITPLSAEPRLFYRGVRAEPEEP
jgi:uncharacterized delta-60 repeat protein